MFCSHCRAPMKEIRGTHHKKKKWRCGICGKVHFSKLQSKDTVLPRRRSRDRDIDKY